MVLPSDVFNLVKETLGELGQQHRFMQARGPDGRPQAALDLTGILIACAEEED